MSAMQMFNYRILQKKKYLKSENWFCEAVLCYRKCVELHRLNNARKNSITFF